MLYHEPSSALISSGSTTVSSSGRWSSCPYDLYHERRVAMQDASPFWLTGHDLKS